MEELWKISGLEDTDFLIPHRISGEVSLMERITIHQDPADVSFVALTAILHGEDHDFIKCPRSPRG